MARTQAFWALAASLGLHAVPLTRAFGHPTFDPARAELRPPDAAALLSGETFEIDAAAEPAVAPGPVGPVAPASPTVAVPPQLEPAVALAAAGPTVERPATQALAPAPAAPRSPGARPADPPASGSTGSEMGAYGEERALVQAASLGKGLLRVLPRVAFPESTFHELAYGTKVRARFSVDLDETGRVQLPPRFDEPRVGEPWFDALVVRALLLLRAGTFAMKETGPGKLEHAFELTAEVVQGTRASGDWLEPRDLAEIGRLVEPTARKPGRAHFIYNSGREVRLTLKLVPRE